MKSSIQILILSFFSVLTKKTPNLDHSSSGSEMSVLVSTHFVFDSEPVSRFLKDFRKIIVALFMVGLLSVPVQLLAAPPSSPAPMAAEEVEKVDQAGSLKLAPRDEFWDSADTRQSSETEAPGRFLTGLAQTGAGLVGGIGFAVVGALLGSGGGVQGFQLGGAFGALLGYGLGTPISVWAVGEWMGWDGSFLSTFGGFAVSLIVAPLVLSPVLAKAGGNGAAVVGTAMVIGIPAGAAFGYHLSADWPTSSGVTAVPDVTSISIVSFDF
jgi:hypothetical protein